MNNTASSRNHLLVKPARRTTGGYTRSESPDGVYCFTFLLGTATGGDRSTTGYIGSTGRTRGEQGGTFNVRARARTSAAAVGKRSAGSLAIHLSMTCDTAGTICGLKVSGGNGAS